MKEISGNCCGREAGQVQSKQESGWTSSVKRGNRKLESQKSSGLKSEVWDLKKMELSLIPHVSRVVEWIMLPQFLEQNDEIF